MIDFKNVRKTFGQRDILDDASFRVNRNERVGLVGPNGAGKSTIFNLICGEQTPEKGEITIPQKARIGFLKQQLDFFKDDEAVVAYVASASGELPKIQERIHEIEAELAKQPADNTELLEELGDLQTHFEHLGGYDMRHKAEAALKGLGFREEDLERPMGSFSGGWQMRACMARTLLGEPDILLLDEPSNYLDTPAVEWLQRRLNAFQGTMLLISHDRFLLNTLTDTTMEIDNGHVTRYPGNYTYYVQEREERRRHAEASSKNIERRKEQLERNINRFRAKASKASQVKSWEKMLDRIEDVEVPDDLHFRGSIRIPPPPHSSVETERLENVAHSYDGKKWILKDINMRLERGDKIGIVGYNGTGKTTLLRILAGRFKPSHGERTVGHKVIIGYQAQEFAELLPPDKTAIEVVKEAGGGVTHQRIREILGAFGFSGEAAGKCCKVLSGGEKIRLCFARIFVNPPNFLVLDEPTTHLDIAAREALQQAVKKYEGTVCVVSHDIEFIRSVSTNIIEMRPGEMIRHFGDYEYYRERAAAREREEDSNEKAVQNQSKDTAPVNAKELRRERAQRRQELGKDKKRLESEIAKAEALIEASEKEKSAIFTRLSDPSPNIDYAVLNIRASELDKIISDSTAKWEKATQALEPIKNEYEKIHE